MEKDKDGGATEPVSMGWWDGVGLVEKPTEPRGFAIPPRPIDK